MKSRYLPLYTLIALLSFSLAALALSQSTPADSQFASKAVSGCCKKGDKDSCQMKGKMKGENGEHAKGSCCKKNGEQDGAACTDCTGCTGCGDSCGMKKSEENTSSANAKSRACGCGKDKSKTGVQN